MAIQAETLTNILNSNVNFKRLYSRHSELKLKIDDLNKIKFPTTYEETKRKQHQKQKLFLKDKMELLLTQTR
jgi:uncharacterized protein YdcH (DUF465 family)